VSGADGRFHVENAPAGRVQLFLFPAEFRGSSYGFARRLADLEGGRTTDVGDVRVPRRRMKIDEMPGDLGFVLKRNPPETEPGEEDLEVAVVRVDGPAARAGLQVGDVIVSVDGHDMRGDASLYWSLAMVPAGQSVSLGLARGAAVKITAAPPP
jgi:S1-C subfamily serine protease